MLYAETNNVGTLQRVNSIRTPNDSNYQRKIDDKSRKCLHINDVSAEISAISWQLLYCPGYLCHDTIRQNFEPLDEKTNDLCCRPGPTQTDRFFSIHVKLGFNGVFIPWTCLHDGTTATRMMCDSLQLGMSRCYIYINLVFMLEMLTFSYFLLKI